MGFLSRFDNKLAIGGIDELSPTRETIEGIPNALFMDPLSIPAAGAASGNLGPLGTPTEKGVNDPYAVEGITDVAHDKGAEIAAMWALGSWLGGGASGLFSGGEGGAAAGAEGSYGAYDPGATGAYSGEALIGGTGAESGADALLLAQGGETTTDVTPGILDSGAEADPLIYPGESADSGPSAFGQPTSQASPTPTQPPSNTKAADGSWTGAAKKYGVPMALLGASTLMSGRKSEMPNKAQYQELSAEAQALARDLIAQYRSGTLSPAQQAQLDQLTQNVKNQINNQFANNGQAGSTAHRQALAKADQDGLALKANMLQTSLQQGLQAIGVAQGPLNAMASYQMQNDKRLQDAYANFARSAAYVYGSQQKG